MPSLSITDAVGWSGYCFCGFAALLLSTEIWKREKRNAATKLRQIVRKANGMANLERVWAITLALFVSTMLVYATTRPPQFPVVTEHKLRIEQQLSDRQWWIVSDEHPQGFMYYACKDFDNAAWIKAGYFAKRATWLVTGECNSIREQGLEFDYVWKPDGTAKTIQEAGYE